jgi:hypothetical protein
MRLGSAALIAFVMQVAFPPLTVPYLHAGQERGLPDRYEVARVEGEKVNVRQGPGTEFRVLGVLGNDAFAVICGKIGSWYRIYLPEEYHVYVRAKDLSIDGKRARCVRETSARVNPDISQPEVGKLAAGTEVRLIRLYGVWWAIEPPLSITGFMKDTYLKPEREIAAAAVEKLLGRQVMPLLAVPKAPAKAPAVVPATQPGGRGAPTAAIEPEATETAEEREATSPPPLVRKDPLNLMVLPRTEKVTAVREAYVEANKPPLMERDFTAVRSACQKVIESEATEKEKEFARLILQDVEFLERVINLLTPRATVPSRTDNPPSEPEKPIAVGWVWGQGRYIGRAGTHVLEKGKKTLYYLVGEDVDLDSCVGKRVSIEAGVVEDLPPHYGYRLIRVKRVKVLNPPPAGG